MFVFGFVIVCCGWFVDLGDLVLIAFVAVCVMCDFVNSVDISCL